MGQIIFFKYKQDDEFVVVFTKRAAGVTIFCLQSKAVANFEYSSTLLCNKQISKFGLIFNRKFSYFICLLIKIIFFSLLIF